MKTDAAVEALARFNGILTSYVDAEGRTQRPHTEVLVALLRSLGVPLDEVADAASLLQEQRVAQARHCLQPVLVHRIGRPETATATIPTTMDPRDVWLTLELEDGTEKRASLDESLAGALREGVEVGGRRNAVAPLDFVRLAGGAVPAGRHHLTLEGPGASERALLLAAPRCPIASRRLGAFMPLHAVRTHEDWGIGSYKDLARLGRWLSAHRVDLLATLPLYPAFLDAPADPSPYLPVSRLAYNEAFIDPVELPEFDACPEAQRLWSGPLRERIATLRVSPLVAYEEVVSLIRTVLEPMSHCASDGRLPERQQAMRAFGRRHPELTAYAAFRARREAHEGAHADTGGVTYHLYCQWAARSQLAEAAAETDLFADLPVGSHPHGFDPEWSPASFVPEVHGGAPPDLFFAGGQDWGFRPLHPERIREDGYRFVNAMLARAFDHAACVRIDHVMGLQRLYMIPDDVGGRGAYVEYRAEELHALVALEATRRSAVVVGEDLGTVPPEVRPRLERDRILRTWVFQFESTEKHVLPSPPELCLAALGTHDLPRFAAYLWGDDIAERQRGGALSSQGAETECRERATWRHALFTALDTAEKGPRHDVTTRALEGCLRHLTRSRANLVLIDMEDLWGERARQNLPGTGPEAANWRRRSALTLEQLEGDTRLATLLESLAAGRVA